MKTQHTPAPWSATQNGYKDYRVIADNSTVALMPQWSHEHDGELQANARLIAAAPALLEACKVALQCAKDEYPESTRGDYGVFKVLRAAINKAEGE